MRTFETSGGSSFYHKVRGISVEVTDNGPGLHPEIRDNLFSPFVTNKAEGTGMGLAVVSRVISDHKGSITVTKTEPKGCRFDLWLPESQTSNPNKAENKPPQKTGD